MKNVMLFEEWNVSNTAIQKHRQKHWKTKLDELNNLPQIKQFVDKFVKERKKIYRDFDSLEIKPVFFDPQFKFLEENDLIDKKFKDAKIGDIYLMYNDQHFLYKLDQSRSNENNLTYTFSENYETKYNVSQTSESRRLINYFIQLAKGFVINLRKEEVPTAFYK